MKNLYMPRATLASLFALAFVTISPQSESAQPAPALPEIALEATIVNNHREAVEAMVWVDGTLFKMGELPAGERRTFTLPTPVARGARYYLLGACENGEWIASDPLTASSARQPIFVVARTERQSYVRYARVQSVADQP